MFVAEIVLTTICSFVFSIQIFLLAIWAIVLFKNSVQLRKRVKCSDVTSLVQSVFLEALNAKLEYRKSLFLLAIVFFELVSSILGISACSQILIAAIIGDRLVITKLSTTDNSSITLILNSGQANMINHSLSRVLYACFGLSLILVFSPVYILMSYYAMIIKNSLSYNSSMKSLDLDREQKNLILCSFVLLLTMLILLVNLQSYILYDLFHIFVSIIQVVLTFYYSKKLVRVFKWKILDKKIAFGIHHYLYRSYTKSLRTFQWCIFLYKMVLITFCIFITTCALRNVIFLTNPIEFYHTFGISSYSFKSEAYIYIYYANYCSYIIQRIFFVLYFISLLSLNMLSIPHLLSRINLWNCSKYLKLSFYKELFVPLLKQ